MAEELDEDLDDSVVRGGDDDHGSRKGGGGKRKKLIMIIAPIAVLLIGTVVAFMTGMADPLLAMFGGGGGGGHAAEEPAAHGKAPPKAGGAIVTHPVPEMLVNLNSRKKSYLKIQVVLELNSAEDQPKMDALNPRIIDAFQVYLRELRVEDLQGSAGMYRLHEELLNRVNAAVKPIRVNDVLFKEMLVQ